MPCAKKDERPRDDPAAGGGGVDPISSRLRRRSSIPDVRYESGLKAKEAGSMVERRRREGRKFTGKYIAAKQVQTADEEKNKKVDFMAVAVVIPHPLVQKKPTLFLQVYTRRDFLNCEAFNASLSNVKRLCAALS